MGKIGEQKHFKICVSICTIIFIVLFISVPFTFAAENKNGGNKGFPAFHFPHLNFKIKGKANSQISTDKPTETSSFISKLIKKKTDKTTENKDIKKTDAESEVKVLKGSIVLSISDCVDYALKHNPNIRIYEDTQKIQKSLIGQAKSNYFPTLFGGTGYYINNTNYSRDKSGSENNNFYGINLGVNQLIWDFGRTAARINMNKYNYEAAGYDLVFTKGVCTYNVRLAYTAVLAARANEDIYGRSVRINELNYDRAKAMYDVGLKSKIDVVNAESYLTQAKIDLLQAQNKYQIALIHLNNTMYYIDAPDYSIKDTETFNFQKNYSVKNEIDVAYNRKNYDENDIEAQIKDGAILTSGIEKRSIIKNYVFKPYDISMTDSIKRAYENRPDLKSLELVKKASEEAMKIIKRSCYPVLNASGGYSIANRSDYTSNVLGVYAGVDLPNINAMATKYLFEQAKAYLDISTINVDMLKKNIYFQIQTDYVNMKQLEKRIPLMNKKVEQTLENFELADGRYAVGLGNYIELQQAQTDYNNAQLAFVQSVFDYNEARFYLERDMGI